MGVSVRGIEILSGGQSIRKVWSSYSSVQRRRPCWYLRWEWEASSKVRSRSKPWVFKNRTQTGACSQGTKPEERAGSQVQVWLLSSTLRKRHLHRVMDRGARWGTLHSDLPAYNWTRMKQECHYLKAIVVMKVRTGNNPQGAWLPVEVVKSGWILSLFCEWKTILADWMGNVRKMNLCEGQDFSVW